MKDSLKIAIAGATGYTGIQLIKILLKHPRVKISYLCAQKSIGKSISFFDKTIKTKKLPRISKFSKIDWNSINVLFTALPNGEAQKIAKNIPNHILLIDLSADFRIVDHKIYKKWYGSEHKAKHLIKKSIYAISEFSKKHEVPSEAIVVAWILHHPARILPVLGSKNPERIKNCAKSMEVNLKREEWYELYCLGRGANLP